MPFNTTSLLHRSFHSLIPSSLQPFLLISYPVPSSLLISTRRNRPHEILYDRGPHDVYFVLFIAVAFTLAREILIRGVFKPFARSWLDNTPSKRKRVANGRGDAAAKNGDARASVKTVSKKEDRHRDHTALRFAEQAWSFLYCSVFWTLGMVGWN